MASNVSPSDALIKVAESIEKLAKSIENADGGYTTKTASNDVDYGSLGKESLSDKDPLTAFLLS